jgi:hypothetical protein
VLKVKEKSEQDKKITKTLPSEVREKTKNRNGLLFIDLASDE